jgi:hypothetical protein
MTPLYRGITLSLGAAEAFTVTVSTGAEAGDRIALDIDGQSELVLVHFRQASFIT